MSSHMGQVQMASEGCGWKKSRLCAAYVQLAWGAFRPTIPATWNQCLYKAFPKVYLRPTTCPQGASEPSKGLKETQFLEAGVLGATQRMHCVDETPGVKPTTLSLSRFLCLTRRGWVLEFYPSYGLGCWSGLFQGLGWGDVLAYNLRATQQPIRTIRQAYAWQQVRLCLGVDF